MTEEQAYLAFLEEIEPSTTRWYIHKHDIALEYGGPEEGGWYYESGVPVEIEEWNPAHHQFEDEDDAYATCRGLNAQEIERRDAEEQYEYTSVLSFRSNHYAYAVEDNPTPYSYPSYRPHYE